MAPYRRLSRPLSEDQLAAKFRELWAAPRLIRETVEEMAAPGSVPNDEYLTAEPMREAEAIRGIHAIADPTR